MKVGTKWTTQTRDSGWRYKSNVDTSILSDYDQGEPRAYIRSVRSNCGTAPIWPYIAHYLQNSFLKDVCFFLEDFFILVRDRDRAWAGEAEGKERKSQADSAPSMEHNAGARSKILRLRSEPKPRVGHPGAPKRCLFLTKISLSHQENNYIHYVKLRQEVC